MYGRIKSPGFWLLVATLTIGAGLRVARINYDSLMFDEQWHLELSTGRGSPHVRLPKDEFIPSAPAVTSLKDAPPWYAVWTNMDFVVHPPLYCTLLRLWRDVFGEGDIAARSFSIICSILAIFLMFCVGREVNGEAVASLAAIIFALAPTQVLLAQMVRGYDLLLAFSMAALWLLVRMEHAEKPSLRVKMGLGMCLLCMMLTHYFAIGSCVAIAIYVLIRFRGQKLRDAVLVFAAAGLIFFVIWGPFLLQQRRYFQETADVWLMETDPSHVKWTLGRLASWCEWLVVRDSGNTPIALFSAALPVVAVIALRRRPDLLLWCLWLAGTLGFVAGLDLIRGTSHLKFARYVSLASPAVFMLFAALLSRPKWLRQAVESAVILISILFAQTAYVSEEPDWRKLGEVIQQNVQPGETLVYYSGVQPTWYIEIFYLGSAHYAPQAFPRPIVRLTAPAARELMRQIPGSTAWLISGPLQGNVSDVLPGAQIIDQKIIENLAICTRVRLPDEH